MSIWGSLVNGGLSLLGQAQANKVETSNNATAVALAQLNNQSAQATSSMLTKVIPIASAVVGLILAVVLYKRK